VGGHCGFKIFFKLYILAGLKELKVFVDLASISAGTLVSNHFNYCR
jgi:hypothetical protein